MNGFFPQHFGGADAGAGFNESCITGDERKLRGVARVFNNGRWIWIFKRRGLLGTDFVFPSARGWRAPLHCLARNSGATQARPDSHSNVFGPLVTRSITAAHV